MSKTRASPTLAIEVRGLRKSYGKTEAVRGVDLRVSKGEVFALLGPNGAGKTTIVEILEGHRDRTAGEVSVLGYDPGRGERALKQRIGIVLQSTGVEPYLSVEETIDLFRGYFPHPLPLDEILDAVGLSEQRRARVRRLSGGQQRRLDVAIGLAGGPELLFLDEPTTGFDPSARRGAWEMVRNLKSLGKTVVLTTHYMDEAEHLADRVAIIVEGKIVAEGTPRELVQKGSSATIRFRVGPGPEHESRRLPQGLLAESVDDDGRYSITTDTPTHSLHQLTGWAVEQGIELEELSVSRPSLEDVFVEIAGAAGPDRVTE
jgi:ABC-2 type transport system ATP-binding protein